MAINTSCPKCGGSNTQAVRMVVAENTQVTANRSLLADRYIPPPIPSTFRPWAITAVAAIMLIVALNLMASKDSSAAPGCFIVFVLLGSVGAFGLHRASRRRKALEAFNARIANLWVCKSCGTEWEPTEM